MRTLLAAAPLREGLLTLDEQESHHGRSVLRLGLGDACRVVDGEGAAATAQVQSLARHALVVEVAAIERHPRPAMAQMEVGLAAPKGGRLDDCVRGLVELGVGAIHILGCERSSRLPQDDRLQRVAREALKQSRGLFLPSLRIVPDIRLWQPAGRLLVCAPGGSPCTLGPPQPTSLVIGPEGGLTEDEEQRLVDVGGARLRLCSTILRIETAAIAAVGCFAHAWESHV